jgi:hypothetical protein
MGEVIRGGADHGKEEWGDIATEKTWSANGEATVMPSGSDVPEEDPSVHSK